jgi:hypothetical protein
MEDKKKLLDHFLYESADEWADNAVKSKKVAYKSKEEAINAKTEQCLKREGYKSLKEALKDIKGKPPRNERDAQELKELQDRASKAKADRLDREDKKLEDKILEMKNKGLI